eukprot:TRINITY_DN13332_c0_g1_i3.p1 TRINITY_DN13332_c0_g1~~TRINITY_DN13332_c0_g1_i3.p1  ORF type:complete len:522 (-),score=147.84 TRINITY_DN13332_c0_g1_i3:42-1607(-)
MSDDAGWKVEVYLYDLSQGFARQFSPMLLGKQIDGIWHTGLVVHYNPAIEYYYGGGIQAAPAGQTVAGRPHRIIEIGTTHIPQDLLAEFLQEISPRFTMETYNLFTHNCNNFSNEVSRFLTGQDIPSYITGLPQEVLETPLGRQFYPMIQAFEANMRRQSGQSFVPWAEQGPRAMPAQNAGGLDSLLQIAASMPSSPVPVPAAAPASDAASPAAAESLEQKAEPSPYAGLPNILHAPLLQEHPHHTLSFRTLSKSTRPIVSVDKKHAQFQTMILKSSNTLKAAGGNSARLALSEAEEKALTQVVEFLEQPLAHEASAQQYALFDRLLVEWPADQGFALLALFRLFVSRSGPASYYAQRKIDVLRSMIQKCALGAAPPASLHLMALCALSNFFSHGAAASVLATDETVVQAAKVALAHKSKVIRVTGANLLFNLCLWLPRGGENSSEVAVEIMSALVESAQTEQDADILGRILSAIGHLAYCNNEAVQVLLALEFPSIAANFQQEGCNDIRQDISKILENVE